MAYERNYRARCDECDWQSPPTKLKAGAQASASRHNEQVYASPNRDHVSAGAQVIEIDDAEDEPEVEA